ncbi:export membrane family protein [Mycobacterium xenopi 4042]|uniref:Export membrane family protein n=1 Tax=Mycobacterium xenopi 4042 TaxID=1299334 RepID=X8DJ76_MYCXE|nr:export membrane family protein [Mycobacterium xenopi 4042]
MASKATEAVEITESNATVVDSAHAAELPHHGFLSRLYTGTGAFEVVGRRRFWYAISAMIVAIAVASIAIRGFTSASTSLAAPRCRSRAATPKSPKSKTCSGAPGQRPRVGGDRRQWRLGHRPDPLRNADQPADREAKRRPVQRFSSARRRRSAQQAGDQRLGGVVDLGWQITKKALIALVVFLVLVTLYITVRYERYMAISALAALFFDLTVTAGVYSLVGFEVTRPRSSGG